MYFVMHVQFEGLTRFSLFPVLFCKEGAIENHIYTINIKQFNNIFQKTLNTFLLLKSLHLSHNFHLTRRDYKYYFAPTEALFKKNVFSVPKQL